LRLNFEGAFYRKCPGSSQPYRTEEADLALLGAQPSRLSLLIVAALAIAHVRQIPAPSRREKRGKGAMVEWYVRHWDDVSSLLPWIEVSEFATDQLEDKEQRFLSFSFCSQRPHGGLARSEESNHPILLPCPQNGWESERAVNTDSLRIAAPLSMTMI
jgi:hypothetical protein